MTESKKVFEGLILLNIANISVFMHVRVFLHVREFLCVLTNGAGCSEVTLYSADIGLYCSLAHVLSHCGTCRGVYKHCVLFHVSVHIHERRRAQPTVMHKFNPFRAHIGKSFSLYFKSNTS